MPCCSNCSPSLARAPSFTADRACQRGPLPLCARERRSAPIHHLREAARRAHNLAFTNEPVTRCIPGTAAEAGLDWSPGISYLFGQIDKALLAPGSDASLASLCCALVIAFGVLAARRYRKGRRIRLRTLLRALFPRRILRSRSNIADIGYFYFNVFLFGLVLGWAILSYMAIGRAMTGALVALFGPMPAAPLPAFVSRTIITLMLFLAYELGYWVNHYLSHHARNPAHFNRKLGSCLAIWDWMFGTLYVPARDPEKLEFGVEPDREHAHTIRGELVAPFAEAARLLTGRPSKLPPQPIPLSASPEA